MGCHNAKLVDNEDEFDKSGKIQTVFRQKNNNYSNNKDYALRKIKECSSPYSNRNESVKTRHNKKGRSNQNESAHQRIIADHRINAKYKVKAVIGKGSFSRVVRVEDRITKQPYAIKMIETIKGQSVFEAELGVLRRVNHPNVIRLNEVIESGEKIYMVMELALGGSLLDRLETCRRFSEADAVKALRMVLSALIYLHNLGITHRDLKPDNLLYYHSGPDSKIMITDFGFASTPKCTGNPYMHTVCGTPQYIAPEIVMRRPYTSAVDMWAMGVICYILLSGTFPFDAEKDNITCIYKQIIKGNYNLDGEVWDAVSDCGKDFISSLLRHNPEDRLTASEAIAHKWIQNVDLVLLSKPKNLKSNLRGTTASQNSSRSTASSVSIRSSRSLRSEHHRVQAAHLEALRTDPEVSQIL